MRGETGTDKEGRGRERVGLFGGGRGERGVLITNLTSKSRDTTTLISN